MQSLLILKPISPVSVSPPAYARAFSPDPKEAIGPLAGQSITIDFGVDVTIDTIFVGYHTATAGQQWAAGLYNDQNGGIRDVLVPTQILQAPGYGPPYSAFFQGAPKTGQVWQIQTNGGPNNTPFFIGVIALGLSFQPQFGHEYGGGRFIEDTGTAERLFSGGFGIDDGVATGGYQWTFGDLQPDELRRLYQLAKDRRTTRSVLVVEDPEQTDGLNERIHWGLFDKLEPYERLNPLDTKWAMRVRDWA